MEKTLEFTIKEALESGRRSAMPAFLEMELREKIALEIENKHSIDCFSMICEYDHCTHFEDANLVRGKK